ncbi:MAG TPA: SDR family oxidoreductase [Salinivirgaceae bacterium]|nr:SDR family oxidoreductase [Salinivirgaceae bacterium]
MISFKNKLCWITGASSGIGKALAIELAKEGADLLLASNNPQELEQVKQECLQFTSNCHTCIFDLADPEEVKSFTERALEQIGVPYLLINNGGISQRSLIVETSLDLHRKILEIDYFSYVIITTTVLPHMIQAGGGYIAATSSISGKFGFPLRSAYAAAKHAVQGFFETLRIEVMPHISVTIAYPGRVNTNISLNALTAEGKAHGKMDPGQAGGISSEKCAKIYLKAIKKRKPEVLIGGKELLTVYIKRFFPRLFFKIITKVKPT